MIQLTPRGLLLLLVTVVPLGASLWLPPLLLLAIVWMIVIVAVLLADFRLTPGRQAWRLTRRHDDRLSLAVWNTITVDIQLLSRGPALAIWLRDTPPPVFGIAEHDRIVTARIAPGAKPQSVRYDVRPPRRGDYAFGDLYLRWRSVLGLFRRQARFVAAEPIKVYPNLADVKKYDLMLRRNRLWELGLRSARLRGAGTEFERLRDYQPDDEYRRINWKATARRGRPITVEYETERSQNVIAVLDVGRLMRSPVGDVAKMDYAINAVLLLAYVAAQKGDKTGLLTFADRPQTWLAPRGGRGQFLRMLDALYAVEGQAVESDYLSALSYIEVKQARRSLVLIFTDLTASVSVEALIAQLGRLRRQHLPLLVTISDPTIQRLARATISDSVSLYERTVAEQLLDERTLALDRLKRLGVLTLDVPADELSLAVIDRYLELKARTEL